MTVHLSLPDAEIMHLNGWGTSTRYDEQTVRLALEDVGQLVVYRFAFLKEKRLLSIPIENLTLATNTQQITTGRRWIVVGSGLTGGGQHPALVWDSAAPSPSIRWPRWRRTCALTEPAIGAALLPAPRASPRTRSEPSRAFARPAAGSQAARSAQR